MLHERHPMGAQAVIRACVFNHIDILRSMAVICRRRTCRGLNEIPVVNGLTALHDSVLRASMVGPDPDRGLPGSDPLAAPPRALGHRGLLGTHPARHRRGGRGPGEAGRILEALGLGA
jgi:hypothetical protein